jgi:hypothetical protein
MKTEPWPAARGLRASYSLEFQRAFLQNEPNFLTPSQSVGCKIPVVAESPAHADAREPLLAWYRQVRGEGDRLDVLVTLVEAWEREHYPMNLPKPVEAIKYHMDQNGLQPRDLIPFIGSRNRVHGAKSTAFAHAQK